MRTGPAAALLVLSAAVLNACQSEEAPLKYALNMEIPEETRLAIRALNGRILRSLRDNDPSVMRDLFVKEVMGQMSSEQFDAHFANLREWYAGTPVAHFQEFEARFSEEGTSQWPLVADSAEGFAVLVSAPSKRLVVSLLVARADSEDLLIGIEHIHRAGSWRLYEFRIGRLRVAGLSAIGWYERAKALHAEGLLVPAAMRLTIARDLLRPVPFMQYTKEEQVLDLDRTVRSEMESTYDFPVELSSLSTTPRVYELEPFFLDDELMVRVHYLSTLERDNTALKGEMQAMSAELTRIFPGLCRDVQRAVFAAYSEPPTPSEEHEPMYSAVGDCR